MTSERRTVSFQEALEWCNGQTVTHEGISGRIELRGERPYQKVYHNPDAKGRLTKEYLTTCEQLRGDWSADLTDSDLLCEHMATLGVDIALDAVTRKTVITVPVKGPDHG
jgi:hypothetical protein